MQAAENYQKTLANKIAGGEQANIVAFQFDHNYLFAGNDKDLPPDKEIDSNNVAWLDSTNVATLHQPDKGSPYWEWMNNGFGKLVGGGEPPVVRHRPVDRKAPNNGLPKDPLHSHVVYCVVVIQQHEIAPPTPIKKPLPVPPPWWVRAGSFLINGILQSAGPITPPR